MSCWIAADWGTTTLRATLMEGAAPLEIRESAAGMGALDRSGFEPALLDITRGWLDAPIRVIACGMVGARQGWAEAPYRDVPCTPLPSPADASANGPLGGLVRPKTRAPGLDVVIVPGLRQRAPHPDVLRGEETQIAGILAARPDFDGIACLPGTHTKWVHLSAGEVVSFRTVMTGELFALLSRDSVLRHSLTGEGWDEDAFLAAVSDALSRPEILPARLFELRAADLIQGQDAAIGRSVLSGLLIGAELAATRVWWLGREIVLTGAPLLLRAYDAALRAQGVVPVHLPARDMTLAGLHAASELA